VNLPIVALSAAIAAIGAALITIAVTGSPLPSLQRSSAQRRTIWWRVTLGVAVAVALWAMTGWPVAGAWMGALAFWLPSLVARGRQRRTEMAVASAVARLAGMLRDQVLVGADVAEAIRGCVAMAPTAIAPTVAEMAERLRDEDPDRVLSAFAAEVNDPMAELLAVSLRFALTRRTAKLAALFDEVARATEEQVRTRRSIEKDRRRLRTAMWSVITAVTVWLVVIYLLSGSYLAPYDAPQGQAVIALAGAAFAVGLLGMAKMDSIGGPRHLRLRVSEVS
jgi:tight adherence protein B